MSSKRTAPPESAAPAAADSPANLPALSEEPPPLAPIEPDTAFARTRRLRRDGWTPTRMRTFLEHLGECGVVTDACVAAGMSARAAYNLRDRDPLFAAGWEAATALARPRLADEAWSRAMNGVVERIYRDGAVVAERHRYDNKLTMAVLARLDARADRAEETGAPHLGLVARWEDYLAAIGEDRREDGMALLAAPVPPAGREVHESAPGCELHELCVGEGPRIDASAQPDYHRVWQEDGDWLTSLPPPPGFDGEEHRSYGHELYCRTLTDEEEAAHEAREAARLARLEAQRSAWFAPAGDSRS